MLAALVALEIVAAAAYGQLEPLNDLFALGQGGGESPAAAPVVHRAEPPFRWPRRSFRAARLAAATGRRRARAGRVGHERPELQRDAGRSPGHGGRVQGLPYIDTRGHECAFYDTTLLFPSTRSIRAPVRRGRRARHVQPGSPVQTDMLTTTPMLSPHESLNLNAKRGLLAAVNGNPATEPGFVSIYDVHADAATRCSSRTGPSRASATRAASPATERPSTATSTALQSITAIDVTNPKTPHAIWQGNVFSHGMTLSDDGNRAYVADQATCCLDERRRCPAQIACGVFGFVNVDRRDGLQRRAGA